MAERTLNTRIKLRYASYAEWQNSSVQLLPGELAVCYIEANNSEIKNTAPTVLFKVGDGEHVFKDLKWSSARAADVYDWAKAESRPEYTKGDVGLGNVRNVEGYAKTETYSQEEINAKIAEIQGALQVDTNTTYEFDLTKANEITIYSKEKGAEKVKVGTFAVNFDALIAEINGAKGRLDVIEAALPNKADKTDLNNYYTKGEADGKFLTEHQNLDHKADKTYVDDELAKKVNTSDYVEAINGVKGRLDTAEGDIDSLEGRMDVVEGKFDGYYTKEEIEGKGYAVASEVAAEIKKVDDKFAGYYTKDEANAEFMTEGEVDARIDAIIASATSKETLDSLVELVEYIDAHGGEAADMARAIEALEAKLEGIDSTVVSYVEGAIAALNIGDYAKASDLLELAGRVSSLEERMNTAESDIDSVEGRVGTLEEASSNHEDRITSLETTSSDHDGRIVSLEGSVEGLVNDHLTSADKDELSGMITSLETSVGESISSLESTVDSLGTDVTNNATNIGSLQTDLGIAQNQISGLETKVGEIEGDYLKTQDRSDLESLISGEEERAEAAELELSNRIKNVEDNYLSKNDVIIWDCGGAN